MKWNGMYLIYCPYNIVQDYCGDRLDADAAPG